MATEKKKRKSFLKSVANLNTDSSKPQSVGLEKAEIQSKKNYALYLVPGLIALTLLAAVAIPIAISINRVVRIQPLNPSDPLFVLKNKDNSPQTVTFAEVEKQTQTESERVKETAQNIRSEIVYYLYEKELEASLKLNSIYQSFNTQAGSFLKLDSLPTVDVIRRSAQEEISRLKTNFQQRFGINNWPSAFADELANNPRYRGSKSEEEAVEKIVISNLQSVAFSAWDVGFNYDFQKVHQNGFQLKNDIGYFYKGEEQEILKSGQQLSLEFLNHAKANNSSSISVSNPSLVALLSKTSQSEIKDAFYKVLDFLLLQRYKIFWWQDLPLKVERSLNKVTFSLSKKDLKNLFQLILGGVEVQPGQEVKLTGVKTVFEALFELPGVGHFSKKSTKDTVSPLLLQKEIADLLNPTPEHSLSNDVNQRVTPQQTVDVSKTSGVSLESLEKLLSEKPHLTPVFFEDLYTVKTLSPNTPSQIVRRLQSLLFPSLSFPLPTEKITRSQLFQLNQKIAEAVDALQDLDGKINKVFHDFFVVSTQQGEKLSSVFKVKDKLVLFSDSKVTLLDLLDVNDYETFLHQVLQNLANHNNSDSSNFFAEFDEVFKTLREEPRILISMLESPLFSNFLQARLNPLTPNKTYTIQDINSVLNFWKNTLNEEKEKTSLKIFEEFQKSLEKPFFFSTTSDFTLQNSKLYFANSLSPQSGRIPALLTFLKSLNKQMGVSYEKAE